MLTVNFIKRFGYKLMRKVENKDGRSFHCVLDVRIGNEIDWKLDPRQVLDILMCCIDGVSLVYRPVGREALHHWVHQHLHQTPTSRHSLRKDHSVL